MRQTGPITSPRLCVQHSSEGTWSSKIAISIHLWLTKVQVACSTDQRSEISLWATENLIPDLTVLLDLDPADARVRLDAEAKEFDRLENEKHEFHSRVRDGFLALAAVEPERWLVLNAAEDREVLAATIAKRVNQLLTA